MLKLEWYRTTQPDILLAYVLADTPFVNTLIVLCCWSDGQELTA